MTRRDALRQLARFDFGQRFILNFAYCQAFGVFPPTLGSAEVLDAVASCLIYIPSPAVLRNNIKETINRQYFDRASLTSPPFFSEPGSFYRCVTFSRLCDWTNPVISGSLPAGYAFGDPMEDADLRKFAERALTPSAIAPGALIRGEFPFAWVASDDFAADTPLGSPGKEQIAGRKVCSYLGLIGFPADEPLFLLEYPEDTFMINLLRRPNALDGFGCLLFKARTQLDSAGTLVRSGYAIDLLKLSEPLITLTDTCDGGREFAAEPVLLNERFHLYWVGRYDPDWSSYDVDRFLGVLGATADPAAALEASIELLCAI